MLVTSLTDTYGNENFCIALQIQHLPLLLQKCLTKLTVRQLLKTVIYNLINSLLWLMELFPDAGLGSDPEMQQPETGYLCE